MMRSEIFKKEEEEDKEKQEQNTEHRWDIWGGAKPSSFQQKPRPGYQGR